MATTTFPELLRTPLPEIVYGVGVPLPSEAGAACGCVVHPPEGYHPWSGFTRAVLDLASRQESGEATFYPPIPFPGKIWSDRGIRSLLYTYWTTPIAQMGQQMLKQPLGFGPPDCVPSLVGKPDFVVFPEVERPASCNLIVVAKSRKTVDPHLKAADLCQLRHPVVRRMFGYLSVNCLYRHAPTFGVFSTYESSWFCVLSDDRMLVSDPVRATDTNPGVLACLWYVLSMAVPGRSVTLPSLPVLEPGFSTRELVASCMTSFDLPDCYLRVIDSEAVLLGDRIHIGNHSLVYKSSYQGMDAVIKCLDVSQCGTSKLSSYLREVHAYESSLKQLQGSAIPKLLDAGFFHGTMFFLLILSDEGEAIESLVPSERGSCFMEARSALQSIHKLGLVHGDVSLANVCCGYLDWSGRWVDLETTRPGTQQEMQDELDKLYCITYPEAARDLDIDL